MRTSFFASLTPTVCLSAVLLLGACASTEDAPDPGDAAPPAGESAATTGRDDKAGTAPSVQSAPARSLEEVEKAFEARKESFRRANSARQSQHAGTFSVTVTFAPSGEVVECRMLSTDFHEDPAFNAAVMAEVWRLRLPPRPGAGEFVVGRYPIVFSARSEAISAPPAMPIVSPPPPQPPVTAPGASTPSTSPRPSPAPAPLSAGPAG